MKKKNRLNEIKMKVKQDTNKDSKIIDLLKYPAAALIILSILRVLSFIAAPGIESYFVVLICAVYFYIGWTATKKYNFSLWKAAFAGALAVIIAAVFYLGTLAVFGKSLLDVANINPSQMGIPPEAVGAMLLQVTIISATASIILGIFISVMGGLIARWIK